MNRITLQLPKNGKTLRAAALTAFVLLSTGAFASDNIGKAFFNDLLGSGSVGFYIIGGIIVGGLILHIIFNHIIKPRQEAEERKREAQNPHHHHHHRHHHHHPHRIVKKTS